MAAADGSAHSLDMAGNIPGAISQTIATTTNNTYFVAFKLAGNPDGGPIVKTLDVMATGTTAGHYSFDTALTSKSAMGWTAEGYSFMAKSSSTTITFTNTTADSPYGPALDSVVVTEVAPTGANCKDDGWQNFVDASGNRLYKNQGACVSFYAKSGATPIGPATP